MTQHASPSEIEQRLRRRFLDRLSQRLRRMRMQLVDRDWDGLRGECRQLKQSGGTFGFGELTRLASQVEESIPSNGVTRAQVLPAARAAAERLISAIEAEIPKG